LLSFPAISAPLTSISLLFFDPFDDAAFPLLDACSLVELLRSCCSTLKTFLLHGGEVAPPDKQPARLETAHSELSIVLRYVRGATQGIIDAFPTKLAALSIKNCPGVHREHLRRFGRHTCTFTDTSKITQDPA
jgi:hypothetical protein